jgi:uncharacterized protein (TIGR03663 family)
MTRAVAGVLAGLALRGARLGTRPMHHDEANQAVKFGDLLERGEYRYDYRDHHGPTLYYLTLPSAWLAGRHTLVSLDETTLRRVPVFFGAATILLLPLLSAGIGRTATAVAALLMAISPAMVFYSRMFIQEALFTCFTFGFVIAVGRIATGGGRAWWMLAGAAAGLAIATKETFVIVLPAAVLAGAIAWWSLGPGGPRNVLTGGRWRAHALAAVALAAAIAAAFYTSFLTAPLAILEPFRGASTYLTRGIQPASHAHPWHYYVGLLAYSRSGGLWWSEGLVLLLALVGAVAGWLPHAEPERPGLRLPERPGKLVGMFWPRYLAFYVGVTALIFSAIPYKTPWNLLPFYVVAPALAGCGFEALLGLARTRAARGALTAILAIASAQLGWQAWRASVIYAADPRNPYVYAQTVPDAVRMADRIRALSALHPDGARMLVMVIAAPYEQWPLPWYLRSMPNVGYWTAPDAAETLRAPVIVSSLEFTPTLDRTLGDSYVSEFYGLRPDVLQALYVERGLWDRFLAPAK